VDGLSPHLLAQRRAFFPHPFAFLTLIAIKPPALHGSLRTQWSTAALVGLKTQQDHTKTPFQGLDPSGQGKSVSPLCHVKVKGSESFIIFI